MTVHKSQGCEFPAVVMPFLSQHYMMLQRNLLYTAMTRAKKLLVIVGSCDALRMAVENMRLEPRFSLLHQRLTELRKQIRKS
ncbi:MAG: ATP-binding domain-containing protein [Lentisphaeria bacterium]|nr:ATP-binding domain-containing protein [Lentisphaeria bacterium]